MGKRGVVVLLPLRNEPSEEVVEGIIGATAVDENQQLNNEQPGGAAGRIVG